MTDLDTLLSAVTFGADARLFFVTSPSNMKGLALKAATTGASAFPGLGPNGGELMPGVTAIASDQIASGAALLVDAAQIAGNSRPARAGHHAAGKCRARHRAGQP